MSTAIARALMTVRSELGITTAKAAELLLVSKMTYEMWERGNWSPRLEDVPALARFTGQDEEQVIGALGLLTPDAVRALADARTHGRLGEVVPAGAKRGA